MTGDQFQDDPSVSIKTVSVYVGEMNEFYKWFEIRRQEYSCEIECLGEDCWDRMNALYYAIIRYLRFKKPDSKRNLRYIRKMAAIYQY